MKNECKEKNDKKRQGRMKKLLASLCILLGLIYVAEGKTETYDYSMDQKEYGRAVAALFSEETELRGAKKRETRTVVLLRMTEGEPDFGDYIPDETYQGPRGLYTLVYADPDTAGRALEYLKEQKNVKYVEKNFSVEACGTDGFSSYGAEEMGFGTAAPWTETNGAGSITVAIIDSGVRRHPLIASRIRTSGFDYVDGDNDSTSDTYGHGTHVAGILADCTPNLPVYIFPIRVLNGNGSGETANTVSALFEAVDAGVSVINLSLVSNGQSEAIDDAVRTAISAGITVVAAAGNNSANTVGYSPVHMSSSGLIVVASCEGTIADPVAANYSNYGVSVDVYAFGTNITSCSMGGGFTRKSGTSQAAPHISALCAIMKLLFPGIGPGTIESRIKILAGDKEVNVPEARLLVPKLIAGTAEEIALAVGDSLALITEALPSTSFLTLHWSTGDNSIAYVDEEQILHITTSGRTQLVAMGQANVRKTFILNAVDGDRTIRFPRAVTNIEDEALAGVHAAYAVIPENVTAIGANVFGGCENLIAVQIKGHPDGMNSGTITENGNIPIIISEGNSLVEWAMEEQYPLFVVR